MSNILNLDIILFHGEKNTNQVSVKQLLEWLNEASKHKEDIADFVYNRLYERYIEPFKNYKSTPNEPKMGFIIMASMSLLIETIQSFKQGYVETSEISKEVFNSFWDDGKVKTAFNIDNTQKHEFIISKKTGFYKNIRCGILHQGETTGGWIINTNNGQEAIDFQRRNINPILFIEKMKGILEDYKGELKDKNKLQTSLWNNCLLKLHAVIKNCERDS